MTNDVLKNVALTVREEVLDKGNTKSPLIKSIPSRVLWGQLHCKSYGKPFLGRGFHLQ